MAPDGRRAMTRRGRRRMPRAACAGFLLLLASCSSTSMYDTSGYKHCVYQMTATPDAVEVDMQIATMEGVLERARAADQRVAPGIHAHLGYLYSLRGDMDSTLAAFLSEKELYPEATVYIDGLLARMQVPAESN